MVSRPRTRGARVEFFTDFSALAKFIGAGKALAQSEDDQLYLDNLAEAAFNDVENEFNIEAAAMGAAGTIKHMFEWGTQGINRGRTNMRPNPLSERARLWGTKLNARGLNGTYEYYFKPSVAFVPKPTSTETGMDPEVIANMRKHIFWNKAMVFETGMEVTIARKEAKFLLMPAFKNTDTSMWRRTDIKRGYRLLKNPVILQPGQQTAGRFTGFWTDFWEGRGQEMIDARMESYFEEDFLADLEVNTSGTVRPAMTQNIRAEVVKEQKRVARNARRRAAYRAKKEAGLL